MAVHAAQSEWWTGHIATFEHQSLQRAIEGGDEKAPISDRCICNVVDQSSIGGVGVSSQCWVAADRSRHFSPAWDTLCLWSTFLTADGAWVHSAPTEVELNVLGHRVALFIV